MRDFVNTIVYNREKLIADIKFLQSRVNKLKATEDDMLEFYGLEHQYYRSKMGASLYESQDPKFSNYFILIHELTLEFETDLKKIINEAYNLTKFNDFFQYVIDEIGTTSQSNNVLMVLDKIDTILMLLLRLYEFKSEIQTTIKNSQNAFGSLKLYRNKIVTILNEVDKLTEYYKIDLPKMLEDNKQKNKTESQGVLYSFCFVIGSLLVF